MAVRGAAAAWMAGLAAAGGLGAWALASTDSGIGDRNARAVTLDDAAVRRRLAEARSADGAQGPPPTRPSRSAGPAAPPARTVRVTGGSVTAVCRPDGRVYLTAWSPDAGFHVDDDVSRGPAATAALEFEPLNDEDGADRPYAIHCAGGRPAAAPPRED
ncbi:hypothetical protein [Streptomyces sp. NPDC048650]|uniref:hypothetical protein n=1 Tax=unclassified Streptomyces TaxID=2593676 RepID=UPI003713E022